VIKRDIVKVGKLTDDRDATGMNMPLRVHVGAHDPVGGSSGRSPRRVAMHIYPGWPDQPDRGIEAGIAIPLAS
jgi:hypothetical protein